MKETTQNVLKNLDNIEVIRDLSSVVHDEANGKISICFPKQQYKKNKIYFLIETENEMNLFKFAELKLKVAEKIGYDNNYDYCEDIEDEDDLVILNGKLYNEKRINDLVKDITPLSKENFANVQKFLIEHYPKLFKMKENNVESKLRNLIAHLQSDTTIWSNLVQDPALLRKVEEEIKMQSKSQESINEAQHSLIYSM